MSKFWIPLVALPLVLGCAATASVSSTVIPSSPQCEIRATGVPGGLRLESVVHGAPGSSGSYQLSLVRSGAGGTSNVSQGGDYEIDGAGEVVVSVTEFNRSVRDHYNIEMTVEGVFGKVHCSHDASRL